MGTCYFELNSDSSGTLSAIIANDNFTTNLIITVNNEEYKVTVSESSFTGYEYIEAASDIRHTISSIIANDAFEGSRYITMEESPYLTLSDCILEFE